MDKPKSRVLTKKALQNKKHNEPHYLNKDKFVSSWDVTILG